MLLYRFYVLDGLLFVLLVLLKCKLCAGSADWSVELSREPSLLDTPLAMNLFDLLTLIFLFNIMESFDVLWLILGSTLTYLNSCVLLFSSDDRLTPLERRIFEILLR